MKLEGDEGEGLGVPGAGAEVAVLVVAGGDRDVELAGAGEELAGGGDDDRGVEAEAVLALGPLVEGGGDGAAGLLPQPRREAEGAAARQLLRLGARRHGTARV